MAEAERQRRIVVVGLGLIGGSLALALKGFEGYEIVGVDISAAYAAVCRRARGGRPGALEDAAAVLSGADVVVLALHPRGIVRFLSEHRERFRPGGSGHRCVRRQDRHPGGGRCAARGGGFHRLPPHGGYPVFRHRARLCRYVPGKPPHPHPPGNSTPEHIALMERMAAHIGCRDVIDHPGGTRRYHRLHQPDYAHHRRERVRRPHALCLSGL